MNPNWAGFIWQELDMIDNFIIDYSLKYFRCVRIWVNNFWDHQI